nr:hypothetical protein [uncultured Rhodopila sp.]
MRVSSRQPFVGTLERTVAVSAQWPMFSPDGRNLAFAAASSTARSVTFFDQTTGSLQPVFDLSPYVASTTIISDWQ